MSRIDIKFSYDDEIAKSMLYSEFSNLFVMSEAQPVLCTFFSAS